jgi:hypothetical protein
VWRGPPCPPTSYNGIPRRGLERGYATRVIQRTPCLSSVARVQVRDRLLYPQISTGASPAKNAGGAITPRSRKVSAAAEWVGPPASASGVICSGSGSGQIGRDRTTHDGCSQRDLSQPPQPATSASWPGPRPVRGDPTAGQHLVRWAGRMAVSTGSDEPCSDAHGVGAAGMAGRCQALAAPIASTGTPTDRVWAIRAFLCEWPRFRGRGVSSASVLRCLCSARPARA